MKKYIAGITTGILLSCTVALAVNYTATKNTFPVKLNGEDVSINGYNIDGSTYFKLRDIADTVGGFDVDFENNTIQLSKDGYVYENILTLTDDIKRTLADYCMRIPTFNETDLTNKEFIDKFIFSFYTGKQTERQVPQGYAWKEEIVKAQFKLLFGQDMQHTDKRFESGYYNVPASNFGDEWYVFDSANNTKDGIDIVFKCTDSYNASLGYKTCHIIPANNSNGYIITSITETTNN